MISKVEIIKKSLFYIWITTTITHNGNKYVADIKINRITGKVISDNIYYNKIYSQTTVNIGVDWVVAHNLPNGEIIMNKNRGD